jgi:hypothetical protein
MPHGIYLVKIVFDQSKNHFDQIVWKLKVPRLFHEFVLKCMEIECASKKCIKGGKMLARICLKVFGNWRYFKMCIKSANTLP